MKYFEKTVGLQLKEDALLIDGVRKIELTHAHQLTQEDEETIADFQQDFIDRDLNLRRTTWKRIENMFDRHGIKMPVDCELRKVYRNDLGKHINHYGNGGYYPDKKCPLSFPDAIAKRQTKRLAAWEKAGKQYEDMGNMTMKEDEIEKKLTDWEKRMKAIVEEGYDLQREAGIPVKAEVINISDYLPGSEEK